MKILCNKFNVLVESVATRPEGPKKGLVEKAKGLLKKQEPTVWEYEAEPGKVRTTRKDSVRCFVKGPPSCRFYALETGPDGRNTGKRWKVHVDGPVDFKAVKAAFKAQAVEVSEADLKKAYGE